MTSKPSQLPRIGEIMDLGRELNIHYFTKSAQPLPKSKSPQISIVFTLAQGMPPQNRQRLL